MKRLIHSVFAFMAGLMVLTGCGSRNVPGPVVGPSSELAEIDSLMWQQPDSALAVLMDYLGKDGRDAARYVSTNETFDNHYAQLLASELLFKNNYDQTNRAELLQAVAYFDSLTFTLNDIPHACRRHCGLDPQSPNRNDNIVFLSARAHYINGAGYYERDSLIEACEEYLCALRMMESHFAEGEMVDKKARFMALTYNRLMDLFSKQFMQEPAIYCGKQGLVYTRIAPTSPYGVSNVLYRIGKQYDKLNEVDSTVYYYDKALELIPDRNNMTYRDIVSSRALFEFVFHSDAITALDSLKSMAAQAENETERLYRYRTIGSVYYGFEQDDSAKFYLMPVFESENEAIDKKIAARLLRDIALIEGDTLKANEYALIIANEGASAAENQAQVSKLNDIFQNYLQEKQETALALERQKARWRNLWIGGGVALLAIVGLAVAIVTQRSHKKRLAAQEAEAQQRLEEERQSHRMEQAALSGRLKRSNETLRELQDQVRQQNDTTPKPETQAASFAEEPICRLIMERVNEGQFKSKVSYLDYSDYALSKEQITALREATDRHFGQFTIRLAKAYPDLTKSDLNYCCLYLLDLNDADIAALMQRAYNTVSDRSRKLKTLFGSEEPLSTILRGLATKEQFH